jgi:hypothetical protein
MDDSFAFLDGCHGVDDTCAVLVDVICFTTVLRTGTTCILAVALALGLQLYADFVIARLVDLVTQTGSLETLDVARD